MLDALYLKSIEKKEEIDNFFNNITKDINIEEVKKEYNECSFDKIKQDKNFAAIDGSFNKTKFMAGYVYAITSQTIISKCGEDIKKESKGVDIKTISTIHDTRIDSILSLQMNIFELKSTIDTLKKHPDLDYMLMDGSISGTLTNYRQPEIPEELKAFLRNKSYEYFEKELEKDEISLEIITERKKENLKQTCNIFIEEKKLDINYDDIEMNIILCLEGYEQLFCINYLLKHFKEKIICVSKTSSKQSLFNEDIPDIAVIEYTCNKSGYTKPRLLESMRPFRYINQALIQVDFPVKKLELTNTPYEIFFTKLEDKSQVLKIEIPRKLKGENEVIMILNNLESISINGYPHILKKAHDEVKIGTKFMKRITKDVNLSNREDRSVLN
ncbi:MAG: hypothetical protein BZ135_06485 [Methanosphaera sp. rholeuAM6]|nr:MAG: hypothetical protein BZ135_06485 [Methanosphaera sp. rholeuAM6]